METPVEQNRAEVDGELSRQAARSAQRPAEVAAGEAENGNVDAGAPRRLDDRARFAVGRGQYAVVGQRAGLAPRLSLLDGHVLTTDDAATTPRNSRDAAVFAS